MEPPNISHTEGSVVWGGGGDFGSQDLVPALLTSRAIGGNQMGFGKNGAGTVIAFCVAATKYVVVLLIVLIENNSNNNNNSYNTTNIQ